MPSSTSASTYRDRTSEFRSLSDTLKRFGRSNTPTSNDSSSLNDASSSKSPAPEIPYRSEFNKKASRIGLGIHETSKKISRLAKLAKKSSVFDDPLKEIQELTVLIEDDITALNAAVSDLRTLLSMEIADGNYSEDRVVHSDAICDDLIKKLMGTTKQFKDALTTRNENIKAHESRKQIFSTNMSRDNPLKSQLKTVAEPPPWSSQSSSAQSHQPSESQATGVQAGNQLRRRLAAENTPSHQMEVSMLQQVAPLQENYSQSRAVGLQNVESTITELSGIFTHLATMVAHQGELAIRIDDNMDESLANVEGARSALLRHLNQISSNRWLLIKIFAILIIFLMMFIFFVA